MNKRLEQLSKQFASRAPAGWSKFPAMKCNGTIATHPFVKESFSWVRRCACSMTITTRFARGWTRPRVSGWQRSRTARVPPAASSSPVGTGKMIDELGMKGTRRGGAVVSEKHANFIVTEGEEATAADTMALAEEIRERVKRQHGIDLEYEVELWSSK